MRRQLRDPKTTGQPQQVLAATWQSASVLLSYPDEWVLGLLELMEGSIRHLPPKVAQPLMETITELRTTPLGDLQEQYVATFDTRRRCSLFLTYFTYGDTRKRGAALLRFKQAYLRSGYVLGDDELPDHLSVVLEYAAAVDQDRGRKLMVEHRAGIEALRLTLLELRSPWAGALDAVSHTLPSLRESDWAAVRKLAMEGPPDEEVGLSPYDGSAFDAALSVPTSVQDLPTPTFDGADR